MSPASIRSTSPSPSISVWMPRSLTPASLSMEQTAFGMPPMPICRQAPSSTSRGDQGRDLAVDLADRRVLQLRQRVAALVDDVVDLADMDRALLAEHHRRMLRDLDDDAARPLRGGVGIGRGHAEIEEAVLVHRRGLEHQDVDRVDEAAVPVRHLAEIHRDVVAAPGIVVLAVVAGEVPAEPLEVRAVRIAFQHLARPHAEAGADLHALELVLARRQRLVEAIRLHQAEAPIQPHAGFDQGGRLRRRNLARLALLALKRHRMSSRNRRHSTRRRVDRMLVPIRAR